MVKKPRKKRWLMLMTRFLASHLQSKSLSQISMEMIQHVWLINKWTIWKQCLINSLPII